MHILVNILGFAGIAVLAAGLAVLVLRWQIAERWWFRPGVVLFGVICGAAVLFIVRNEFNLVAYAYVFLMALLVIWHVIEAFVTLARTDWSQWKRLPSKDAPPELVRARALARAMDFVGAAAEYDDYLERVPADSTVRGRLAEMLIKAGNAKRAIAVLTVAFSQSQDTRERIAFGIRLAELILVVRRDPLAARAQIENLKNLYADTEHAEYVETLAAEMTKRVGQGRYLKARPDARR